MKLKQPVRGIHIGSCVDGTPLAKGEAAHAHLTGSKPRKYAGFICAQTKRDLATFLLHELAHLAADAGHDDRWRTQLERFGARVPAAYKKRKR